MWRGQESAWPDAELVSQLVDGVKDQSGNVIGGVVGGVVPNIPALPQIVVWDAQGYQNIVASNTNNKK